MKVDSNFYMLRASAHLLQYSQGMPLLPPANTLWHLPAISAPSCNEHLIYFRIPACPNPTFLVIYIILSIPLIKLKYTGMLAYPR